MTSVRPADHALQLRTVPGDEGPDAGNAVGAQAYGEVAGGALPTRLPW